MNNKTSLPTIATWIIFAAMVLAMGFNQKRTETEKGDIMNREVRSFYGYLPAAVVYGDVQLNFLDDEGFSKDEDFVFYTLENGKRLIGSTMGMSLLWSPFFITAHMIAPYLEQSQDGFSPVYQFFLVLSSLFYVTVGLLILRRILLKYFSPLATALSLIAVGLGTNLFFYTVYQGPMPHAYSFALITLFLYLVIRWHEEPNERKSIFLGLTYGLIVLLNPSHFIVGILFLAWGVRGSSACWERIRILFRQWRNLLVIIFFFMVLWIPQCLYWKAVCGTYLYNPYAASEGGFLQGLAHIRELLFSDRNGWFVYTPLMGLASLGLLVGLFVRKGKIKEGMPAVFLYLLFHIYLVSLRYPWWNGESFGLRAFVDIYGVMALPLAALLERALKYRRFVAILAGIFLAFLVIVNQYQTYQYTQGTTLEIADL